ncbi:PGF-CTERM sorting domain-containing protein [Halococcus thailandensis]|uniref:Peptidase C-terminal archaeal/bacterial domain-containing protein n=1 Tax=Halococcus thailandensis JCM 13552 TaxID=1227457 RepID=M0N1P7_9EURY|nr:PGF-CTERM sorting domain-containing protein [Halococcus thailandensis]EMA50610.1 hypothetical protein C451_16265 [Halococcus thailandensis JCM 13552]
MLFFDLIGPDGETIDDTNIGRTSTRGQIATTVEESGTYYIDVHASSSGSEVPYSFDIQSPDDVSTPTPTETETPASTAPTNTSSATTPNETSVQEQSREEIEPNDAQDAATGLNSTKVDGEIGDEGDVDWYEFRVEENTEVSILFTADPSDTMLFFDLIGPDGETIDDTNIGRTSTRGQIATTVEESGTYYIDVHASSGGSEVPYSFTIHSPDDVSPPTATATQTSTQISTATQTSTATQNNTSGEVIADDETTATTTDDGDDGSGASGPGFGIVAALVALVAVVVLSVRR